MPNNTAYPVLYIEEIEETIADGIDWRIFIRTTKDNTFVVYGTRRPISDLQSNYEYLRMEFNDRVSLVSWLQDALCLKSNRINLTMYMFNRSAIISDDFVGYNNLRRNTLELYGYDKRKYTRQMLMRTLYVLANHRAY